MRTLMIAALVALGVTSAKAADIDVTTTSSGNKVVTLDGQIVEGDAERFAVAMHKGAVPGKGILIVVNTPGGDWDEANRIGIWMRDYRRKGWHVNVGVVGMCASSCITILAMAERRAITDGSIVNVHTVVSGTTEENATENFAVSVRWARWLRGAGVPSSITNKLLMTGSREGADVTHDELAEWGFEFITPAK